MKGPDERDHELIERAREAIRLNYDAACGKHTVGAAVRCGSGKTIVAVRGRDGGEIVPPCGNCRQMMCDYMPECEVILPAAWEIVKVKAAELLPFAYSFKA